MSFITRKAIGRRLGSVNSINSALQPRTSVAFVLPRFVTIAVPTNSSPTNGGPTNGGAAANSKPEKILSSGLKDHPELILDEGVGPNKIDWSKSFHGLSVEPFSKETADVLLAPLDPEDVEIKPDGIIYMPEIKYRRILNKAFGPGAWGLAPRGETIVTDRAVTREYALVCNGRLVSVARGEQSYFDASGIPTATEGCKSNALMRCCKDLGIASELWDPRWIRSFKKKHCDEKFGEHQLTKKKKKLWVRKGEALEYPYKAVSF
ncbi:mitochondrial genome maintenance MGM101-domain-containing protein [Morchella snyderi]|nr:mitochondrial genome maintenance MGM101-domain-containing protein [Morchella snyderi]